MISSNQIFPLLAFISRSDIRDLFPSISNFRPLFLVHQLYLEIWDKQGIPEISLHISRALTLDLCFHCATYPVLILSRVYTGDKIRIHGR